VGNILGSCVPVHNREFTIPERGNDMTPQLTKYLGEGSRGMRVSQMLAPRGK